MKKQYETPVAEKIEFCYRDQVVASGACTDQWLNEGQGSCQSNPEHYQPLN